MSEEQLDFWSSVKRLSIPQARMKILHLGKTLRKDPRRLLRVLVFVKEVLRLSKVLRQMSTVDTFVKGPVIDRKML